MSGGVELMEESVRKIEYVHVDVLCEEQEPQGSDKSESGDGSWNDGL